MTMNQPQLYRSPEPSGIRKNVVRLCVALLGIWVVAISLFLQPPMLPFSMPEADYGSVADVSSMVHVASLEEHDQDSSGCCPDVDCSDSQDCSLPCASSCAAPLVAVLESLLYRELPSGDDRVSAIDDNGFVKPTASALFRPPIV